MKPKLCFCASSGGHYYNILQLKNLADKYPSFTITENQNFKEKLLTEGTYLLPMLNRKKPTCALLFVFATIKILFILIKEKPNYIISSGALATVPVMFIAKLLGKKVVFFETTARVNSPSITGKIAYRFFANLFIVQYESMLKIYPKAQVGSII